MSTPEETGSTSQTNTPLSVTLPPLDTGRSEKSDKDEAKSEKPERKQSFKAGVRERMDGESTPRESRSFEAVSAKPEKDLEPKVSKVSTPDAPRPSIIAPGDMRAEEKEAFEKADPALQSYLSRRALEVRQEYGEQARRTADKEREFSALGSVVTPEVRNEYARLNLSVPTVVDNSIAWDRAIRANPAPALLEFIDHHGVSLDELIALKQGNGQPQQREQPKYLTAEEARSLAQAEAREILKAEREQDNQSRQLDTLHTTVTSWMKSKPAFSDPGTAAQLEAAMAPRVERLKALDPSMSEVEALEEAFNHVLAKDPAFRALNQQLTAKPGNGVVEAKRASRSIHGGPGSGTPTIKDKDFRSGVARRMNS